MPISNGGGDEYNLARLEQDIHKLYLYYLDVKFINLNRFSVVNWRDSNVFE
jgi:hypothetical protein